MSTNLLGRLRRVWALRTHAVAHPLLSPLVRNVALALAVGAGLRVKARNCAATQSPELSRLPVAHDGQSLVAEAGSSKANKDQIRVFES